MVDLNLTLKLFCRLPYELRHQIYQDALIAESKFPFQFFRIGTSESDLETVGPCEEATVQALELLVKNKYSDCKDEAQAYFFSHNATIVYSKADAVELVQRIQGLQEKGYHSAHVDILDVKVPAELGRSSEGADPNDFEPDDQQKPGVRAYRILKPLTALRGIDRLRIYLMDSNLTGQRYAASTGIQMIAAVIGKMLEGVVDYLDFRRFSVNIQVPEIRTTWYIDVDVTWLWDLSLWPQSKFEPFKNSLQELETPERAIERFLSEHGWGDNPTLVGIGEKEFLPARSNLVRKFFLSPRVRVFALYEQCVRRLIEAEDWEAKAEAVAKQLPSVVDGDLRTCGTRATRIEPWWERLSRK